MECQECARLWSVYADLVHDQVQLLTEYYVAVRMHDEQHMHDIETALKGANEFLRQGNEELMNHRATYKQAKASSG